MAERDFLPHTSGVWSQHASTAPLFSVLLVNNNLLDNGLFYRLMQYSHHTKWLSPGPGCTGLSMTQVPHLVRRAGITLKSMVAQYL